MDLRAASLDRGGGLLRPERPDNYYETFDIVPLKYRPLLQSGKVLVTNWHAFAPESEHVEKAER